MGLPRSRPWREGRRESRGTRQGHRAPGVAERLPPASLSHAGEQDLGKGPGTSCRPTGLLSVAPPTHRAQLPAGQVCSSPASSHHHTPDTKLSCPTYVKSCPPWRVCPHVARCTSPCFPPGPYHARQNYSFCTLGPAPPQPCRLSSQIPRRQMHPTNSGPGGGLWTDWISAQQAGGGRPGDPSTWHEEGVRADRCPQEASMLSKQLCHLVLVCTSPITWLSTWTQAHTSLTAHTRLPSPFWKHMRNYKVSFY